MTVDSWQPAPVPTKIESNDLEKLLAAASDFKSNENFTPDLDWIQPLAMADHVIWQDTVQSLNDEDLIALIKLLTVTEAKSNWDLGEKSPVIPVFKTYKKKSGVNRELVKWVKEHSDNKYLPFGPLI